MRIYVLNLRSFFKGTKILAFLLVIACLLTFIIGSAGKVYGKSEYTAADETPVIIIDAGHGGEDSGAIGYGGVLEKNLNLEVANELGKQLSDKGYTVVYTRNEDKMLISAEEDIKGLRKISDLKNRCKITSQYQDPIFISIHMNSYGASKYSGLQVYYTDENDASKELATMVQTSVRTNLQNDNKRQIKSGKSIYVLENCSGTGILIECGFLSNEDECKQLSEKEYQKELSFSILCGIIEYIEAKNNA